MRKATLIFALGFMLVSFHEKASAQDKPNEVYVGWSAGLFGAQYLYEVSLDLVDNLFNAWGSTGINEKTSSTGIIYAGYGRFLNHWLKIGVNGSYVHYTTSKDYQKEGNPTRSVKWRDSFITAILRADFHYVKKENVTMYSGLAAGVSFTNSKVLNGDPDIELGKNTLFA